MIWGRGSLGTRGKKDFLSAFPEKNLWRDVPKKIVLFEIINGRPLKWIQTSRQTGNYFTTTWIKCKIGYKYLYNWYSGWLYDHLQTFSFSWFHAISCCSILSHWFHYLTADGSIGLARLMLCEEKYYPTKSSHLTIDSLHLTSPGWCWVSPCALAVY